MNVIGPRAEWTIRLESLEATLDFGHELGRCIQSPGLIAFFGELGSGKTTLIQAIGEGLGITGRATSPTYTIINLHPGGRLPLLHVDCYRIEEPAELYEIGLDEWLAGPHLVCMEWSEHARALLPGRRMELRLACPAPEQRTARLLLFADLWPELDRRLDLIAQKSG
ncbi:MAG: tRNA (adenosine(37)-N6)-threonylcarbamoyltransferase complex ATPase subunit type 1 TsaE [Candidatus Glassbacteria bacterium]|nr:tRNA (adenosine(37)-N6)-threonylcarbamoyltransferase complex ATPase subunit type 1 TsaE [Candidatus Glassbacteria bacterium]